MKLQAHRVAFGQPRDPMEFDDDMGGLSTKGAVRRVVQFSSPVSLQPNIASIAGRRHRRRQRTYRDTYIDEAVVLRDGQIHSRFTATLWHI